MRLFTTRIKDALFPKKDHVPPARSGIAPSGTVSTTNPRPNAAKSDIEVPSRIPPRESSKRSWLLNKILNRRDVAQPSIQAIEPRSEETVNTPPRLLAALDSPHPSEANASLASPVSGEVSLQDGRHLDSGPSPLQYQSILAPTNQPPITLDKKPIELTINDALEKLNAVTLSLGDSVQKNPGWLKTMLEEAIKNGHGNEKLRAELTLALNILVDADPGHRMPNEIADASVLALWKGGLEYARDPIAFENRKKFPQPSIVENAEIIAKTFMHKRLLKEEDKEKKIIDIGTGYGFIPAKLRELGFDKAFGLEPRYRQWRIGATLYKIDLTGVEAPKSMTAAKYMKKHPGVKIPVVTIFNINFGNNNPDTAENSSDSDENLDEGYGTFMSELGDLTGEKLLIGVYGGDIRFAPGQSCSFEQHLKKKFKNVKFILDSESPLEQDMTLASCGLLGVYRCTDPIRTGDTA